MPRPRLSGLSELPMPPSIGQREAVTRLIGAIYHDGCRPRIYLYIHLHIAMLDKHTRTHTQSGGQGRQCVVAAAMHQAPGNSVTGITSLAAPASRQDPGGEAAR